MFRYRTVFTIACLIAALTGLTYIATLAADDQAAPTAATDSTTVEGKFLAIRTNRALDDTGVFICKVVVRSIGDEKFLVGEGYDVEGEWKAPEGVLSWVSVKHIETILVSDTLEQMKKQYEQPEEK
jgi:hypothetical protein